MTESEIRRWLADLPSSRLDELARRDLPGAGELSNAMLISWFSRPDLQDAFELSRAEDRRRLRRWCLGGESRRGFGRRLRSQLSHLLPPTVSKPQVSGVNLIGYAEGVLGMGEHVRMSAAAMAEADIPSGIFDFALGLGQRRQTFATRLPRLRSPKHRCNLFHINADQMLRAYWNLGAHFFSRHYNIGYWAWELARWPVEWTPVIGTVDEIWAPSTFVREALAPMTSKPVVRMPLCVELPEVGPMPRSEFGAGDDDYLFAFTFDCHSYMQRKNPLAIVRAFRAAFPAGERARLVIKAMHSDLCVEGWRELVAEAASDDRIRIIDAVWQRDLVLSLIQSSDAYVSLHRSEGFGRGPAEAMLLGKPAIVTNYSGTADFCRSNNALLVDYNLVDVPMGGYVGAAGQVWAEPSVEHAAQHMRALFDDRTLGPRVGAEGRQTISKEFSASAIGHGYRARLIELGMI